jgi:hypothetical protein
MLANLQQLGYAQMTPIQAASLPLTLQGKDLIAQASTGSGKTAAFGLPMVDRLEPALVCRAGPGAVPHARTGRPGRHRDPPPGARRTTSRSSPSMVACLAQPDRRWKTARTSSSAPGRVMDLMEAS